HLLSFPTRRSSDLERLLLAGPVVEDRRCAHALVAVDLPHLTVRVELDLPLLHRFPEQRHGVRVRAEALAPVDQDEALHTILEVERSVHRRVAAADDEDAFPVVLRRVLDVIAHPTPEEPVVARALERPRRERTLPG